MVLLLVLFAASSLVINEVCYDPPGPDGGAEFVEIFNPASRTVPLDGARLEFANGCVANLSASRVSYSEAPNRRMHLWSNRGYAAIDFGNRSVNVVPFDEVLMTNPTQLPFRGNQPGIEIFVFGMAIVALLLFVGFM